MRQTAILGRFQVALYYLNQTLVILACGAEVVAVPERVVGVHLEVGEAEARRARTRLELETRIVREQQNVAVVQRACNMTRGRCLATAGD